MNPVWRITCATTMVLACLDGQAKVNDRCITTLEARAGRAEDTAPRTPCPVAVRYQRPSRQSAARPAVRPASIAPLADAGTPASSEAMPPDAERSPRAADMLHV